MEVIKKFKHEENIVYAIKVNCSCGCRIIRFVLQKELDDIVCMQNYMPDEITLLNQIPLTAEDIDWAKRQLEENIETIDVMRERHKKEIERLQAQCRHGKISECMPFAWAPGHYSHCVKICEICGMDLFTTYRGDESFDKYGKSIMINKTPKEKVFDCPKRNDCFLIDNGKRF